MESVANGGEMSEELSTALLQFDFLSIAEEGAEGIHRDVSNELMRAKGTRIYALSASTRLAENISFCTRYAEKGPEQSERFNDIWATIAQQSPGEWARPWRPGVPWVVVVVVAAVPVAVVVVDDL